ncbi:peptide chain release factor 1 [Candidatus Woesearchaeota archaeon CG08_land_8_20_14_0_20_43_7]|nr:MAG: peptide chain release factor 1 [Candidatus Woesearchaeota archaeon CG08_land_8_20_14_0_20_43_7]
MNAIINHLSQEQGTATNIKSSSTRKNVIDALERMIQHLRVVGRNPPNGLAAFSGNVSEREGQSDVKVWSMEPPVPVNLRLYRCDKEFVLDPLREMCETREVYGLVVMDRREATIAILRGKSIQFLAKMGSSVPGKTRAGGQSAHRFEQLREIAAHDFYKRISNAIYDAFFDIRDDLKGILLGGPGPTKYTFQDGDYIKTDLKNKIIAVKDLSYTDEFGCQELVDKCQDVLANEEIADEKKTMADFFKLLSTNSGKVAYGMEDVKQKLLMGAVDLLLLSESLDDNVIDSLEEEAAKVNSTVKLISTETREGEQLREMGKIAAILRYNVDGY